MIIVFRCRCITKKKEMRKKDEIQSLNLMINSNSKSIFLWKQYSAGRLKSHKMQKTTIAQSPKIKTVTLTIRKYTKEDEKKSPQQQ